MICKNPDILFIKLHKPSKWTKIQILKLYKKRRRLQVYLKLTIKTLKNEYHKTLVYLQLTWYKFENYLRIFQLIFLNICQLVLNEHYL